MDFDTFANGIYANINQTVRLSKDGKPEVISRDQFLKEAWQAWNEAADKRGSDKLYAGSETRAALTETEIAVLRNKYDVRNMSDEQYDAFLDDLEDMGAISRWEKGFLGYNGKVVIGYQDETGEVVSHNFDIYSAWSWLGKNPPVFKREDANGDILKWVSDRLKWKPDAMTAAQQKNQAAEIDLFENLSAILARMTGTLPVKAQQSGAVDEDEEPDLIDQIADPNSAFYQDMLQRMRLQWEQSEEDKKEQAVIDALGAILDGMRSTDGVTKRKDMATSVAGLSKQISELDAKDPRRKQLDLFRQRLNQLGIFVDLDLGVKGSKDKDKGWQTLTQHLIDEENSTFDPSIFDLI